MKSKNFLMIKRVVLFLTASLFFFACTSSEETQKVEPEGTPSNVYVFDNVATNADSVAAVESHEAVDSTAADTIQQNLNSVVLKKNLKYYVQVGAFTTKARAERFVTLNEDKITFPLNITFNEKVKLYVVRLPFFRTREEAEKVRDTLWQTKEFKDAFIVTEIE